MANSPPPLPPIPVGNRFNDDNNDNGPSSGRLPPPILLIAKKRNFSSSMKGTIAMPRSPSLPPSPSSPRRRQGSSMSSSAANSENIINPNLSQERVKNILDILDRNDARDTLYKRNENCCLYRSDVSNNTKSYYETKFMKREYPSYFSTDRQFFRFVIHQFYEALKGVDERFPNYYSMDKLNELQMNGMIGELDMWFTLLDECINQESQHSKVNSFILRNIMEVFQQDFTLLIEQVKREEAKIQEVKDFYAKKDETSDLKKMTDKYNFVVAENERLKREIAQIQEENSKFHVENFNLRNQMQNYQDNVNGLLNTTDQLRLTISAGEQKIHEITKEKPQETALEATFTAVPKDVLEYWIQSSQFLTAILNDSLTNLDLDKLFPVDMKPDSLGCYLTIERPNVLAYTEDNVHFSKLYHMIKNYGKNFEPSKLYEVLESKIRTLFQKLGSFIVKRNEIQTNSFKEKEKILNTTISELRNEIRSNPISDVFTTFVNYPELYIISKKAPDLQSQMMIVFQKADELMTKSLNKPQNTVQVIMKSFEGNELLQFLAQVAKGSRTDIHADMFRQFVTNELPFHMFLYYAKIYTGEKSDLNKRTAFLMNQFQHFGWNLIPLMKRRSLENKYCPSPVTFPIFALSIYQHLIESLAISLADIVDQTDVKGFLLRKENNPELIDYLVAISEKGEPSVMEYSVIMFNLYVSKKKKEKIIDHQEECLKDFDPIQSKLIDYMATFGQKKDKKKPLMQKSKKSSLGLRCTSAKLVSKPLLDPSQNGENRDQTEEEEEAKTTSDENDLNNNDEENDNNNKENDNNDENDSNNKENGNEENNIERNEDEDNNRDEDDNLDDDAKNVVINANIDADLVKDNEQDGNASNHVDEEVAVENDENMSHIDE